MEIRLDDLSDPRIEAFLEEHLEDMRSVSPPESKHALDLAGLKSPQVSFWSMWDEQVLVACGALKYLDDAHAEVKSMRVSTARRGQGLASQLLSHMLEEAVSRGYQRVSLETGSMEFFEPARVLYKSFGFRYCAPFANYTEDPHSVFMSLDLSA
ncbi:GNAT family N-acetyltransferase [Congregibacter variabilis]|uniref:GNAT family N-acetyltransferase n=1 Tax=Congregibacter variabilis TaxID=3081200 RepID=A0ABZ0I7G2_9GAMM|nr:GNAT family N-acetyltransferase [Congregibacter sp. IMCC43200]